MASNIKRLKGLKGLSDLSNKEYQQWRAEQIRNGYINNNTSYAQEDRIYRNQQFANTFGKDLFFSMTAEQRDQYYKDYIVNNAVKKKFGNQANFNEINSLSTDNKLKVYETIDADTYFDSEKKRIEEQYKSNFGKEKPFLQQLAEASRADIGASFSPYVDAKQQYEDEQNVLNHKVKYNQKALTAIIEQDRLQKGNDDDAFNYSNQLYEAMVNNKPIDFNGQNMDASSYVNNRFYSIGKGYTESQESLFGQDYAEHNGSNYYKAFEDTDIIKKMPDQEKAKLVATYEVMKEKYGSYIADQIFDTQLHNYISEQQGFWEKEWSDTKNIALGGTANLMNKVLGMAALGIAATQGKEALAQFMNGVDENGNLTGAFFNPTYWNGVDMYNTLDMSEINKANKNGGISPYNNVYAAGQDLSLLSEQTYHEVKRQTKYLWSEYLSAMAMRGAGNLTLKGVTNATVKGILNKAVTGAVVMGSGVGMAETEGKLVFDQTLQQNKEILDDKKYQDAQEYAKQEITKNENQALIETTVQQLVEQARQEQIQYANQLALEGRYMIPQEIDETAIRQEVVDDFMRAKTEEYLAQSKYNGRYSEDEKQALLSAADAYMVTATIQEIREAASNSLWGQFKFDRGTRNALKGTPFADNIEIKGNTAISNLTGLDKAKHIGKKMITPMWEGFSSEWGDGVTEGFGTGFGLGTYNNYLAKKYNPEQAIGTNLGYVGDWLAGLQYATDEAVLAMTDKETLYEAGIGLLSPVTSITPRFENFVGKYNRAQTKADNIGKSFGYKINSYINNPIMDGYYEAQNDINNHNATVERLNNVIYSHKDKIDDIYNMVSTYSMVEAAKAKGNNVQMRDNKIIGAIDMMKLIEDWSQDEVLSQTDVIKQAQQDLENVLGDNVSDEDWTKLIAQYKARNKETSETDEEIKERITKNISDLNKYYDSYKQNLAAIDKKVKKSTPDDVRDQLAKMMTMESSYQERIASMESELTGNSTPSTVSTPEALYGSYKAYQETLESKKQQVESIKQQVSKLKEGLKKYKGLFFKVSKQQANQGITKEQLIEATQLELNTTQELLTKEQAELKEIEKAESIYKNDDGTYKEHPDRVLTADEIINLNPKARKQMFTQRGNYSVEQRLEIDKAERTLKDKDPDYASKISDIVTLQDRLEESQLVRSRLQDEKNAVAIDNYIQRLRYNKQANAYNALRRYVKQQVASYLDRTNTFDELVQAVYSYGNNKGLSAEMLQEYLNDHKERNTEEAQELVKALRAQKDARVALDQLFGSVTDNATKANIFGSLASIFNGLKTVDGVMTALEQSLQTSNDPTYKNFISKVLDRMTEMDYQRNSTTEIKQEEQPKVTPVEESKQEGKTGKEEPKEEPKPIEKKENSNSPSLQEQLQEFGSEDVQLQQLTSSDAYATANETPMTSDNLFAGNPFVEYEKKSLEELGKMVHKKSTAQYDTMDQFYTWLNENGLQMQEIIDNELGDIIKNNPDTKVRFLFRKPQILDYKDQIQELMILAIELDSKTSKYHNRDRGQLSVNGKEYIVIGSVWADFENPAQKVKFLNMQTQMRGNRNQFFEANPASEYYVDDTYYTHINQMTVGYRVTQLAQDSKAEYRGVAELANGEVTERNPEGLSVEDLKWGIVIGGKMVTIGVNERNAIFPLKNTLENDGNTYLFIKSANGTYIPMLIKPVMYNELVDSPVKTRIDNLLAQITSPILEERLDARSKLRNLLSFNEEKHIDISKDTITIVTNYGRSQKSFSVGQNFDRVSFMRALDAAKFRINITVGTLRNPSMIKEYSDAGILTTSIAKLGTANSIFDIYTCKDDGTPEITKGSTWYTTPVEYEQARTKTLSVNIDGNIYRPVGDKFYDSSNNQVTDESLIHRLSILSEIYNRQISFNELNGKSYYIIRDTENPFVVSVDGSNNVEEFDNAKSQELITKIKEEIERKNREQAAKKALQKEEKKEEKQIEDAMITDEIMTEEAIARQALGDFEETPVTQQTDTQVTEKTLTESSKQTQPSINTTINNSVNSFDNSEKSSTFAEIFRSKDYHNRIFEILSQKGWGIDKKTSMKDIKRILSEKNMSIDNITDIDNWIKILTDCR